MSSFGESLLLTARDPEWLFAYWEICPETVQRAIATLGEAVPVLRVTLRTDTGFTRTYDERVDLSSRRHYLHVPEANRVYQAELGFRTHDGQFVPALTSNEVNMAEVDFAAMNTGEDPRF